MDIIPHNPQFVQVGIGKKTDNLQDFSQLNQKPPLGLSEIQEEAHRLFDAGLNVFPQPIASKGGYPWMRLQYSRLNQVDSLFGLSVLFAGHCNLAVMCGTTSNNLFVIDCESRGAFLYHIEELRKRQIPVWAATSARGGHIYLRASDGEVQNISAEVLGELEIRGRGGYVLAPPSVHPSGAKYSWVAQDGDEPPTIHSQQLDWLFAPDGKQICLEVTSNSNGNRASWSGRMVSPASNLSSASREYISSGHLIKEGNRNNRLFNTACDLAGNGYSHADAESILLPVATLSGLPYKEGRATIASAFSRARSAARPEVKPVNVQNWHYALLWATETEWQGKKRATDRSVMLAMIERSRLASNENGIFRASIRELSELAHIGTTSVQKALKRLKKEKILLSKGNDHMSQATLWQFNEELLSEARQLELNLNTVSIPPHWLRYSESLFNSNITERGALGHSVSFVYQFMRTLEAPMMPSAIAESLGLSLNQINYAIRKLKDLELIVRHRLGWYPVNMSLPELEAMFENVDGKASARAARFRREREIFAGKILYRARLRREGGKYFEAVKATEAYYQAFTYPNDALLQLGFELGGVLRL